MSVPTPLLELMSLLEDVTRERSSLEAGPFRVEADLAALLETPRDPVLDGELARAYFLAPLLTEVPSRDQLQRIGELVTEHDLFLDLRIPGLTALEGLPDRAALRTARVEMQASDPEALSTAPELVHGSWGASLVAGRTTYRVEVESRGVPWLPHLVERMATFAVPVDLIIVPVDPPARAAVEEIWETIERTATTVGLNVVVRGGARADRGEVLDPLSGFNVLAECIRAIFRSRRSLCPFPFLLLRWERSGGRMAVCPAPGGPSSALPGEAPWNGTLHREVRAAFYAGEPPEPCRRCTLLAHVRRAAEETPWSTLPPGALEV